MANNQKLRKLTQGEQKQLHCLIQKSSNSKNVITAQQSIPYIHMYSDGLCHIKDNLYSKCIRFGELNYQLAGQEEQQEIFGNWCGLFNQIDTSINIQISFYDQNLRDITLDTLFPFQKDVHHKIRDEYFSVISKEFQNENNTYNKEKYLTYTIRAENPKTARTRFAHIEREFLNQFETLGVSANVVTGYERLEIMHGIFHPQKEQFWLSWEYLTATGLTTKDVIAPSSFTFKDNRYFQIGDTYGAASFVQILASELSDRLLSDILHSEQNILVSLHIKSINQIEAIRQVKRKITDLDKMKIEEQKRAVRSGYDMEILPSDLATYGMDAKNLLQDLQNRNERMFLLTFLVVNFADSKEMLENKLLALSGIVQKHNCMLTRLDYQQEEGFMSCLPLGYNQISITRNMTTSSTAILIPFTTQELIQKGKAVYYGINAISRKPIICDRMQLKNPNGIILGTPGAGKSFTAKREIIHVFLTTDDDIIVCDPESEYSMLTEQLQGQVIKLSPATTQYINPMDINFNYSDDDNPLALKSDFILSLCELILGNKGGLEPIEKSVIDRSVRLLYQRYFDNPIPENMPLLEDLYKALLNQPESESKRIASALDLYVYGSLNVFNHHTNVSLTNRFTCFDIKQLGKQLKKLGMLILQDHVWNKVTQNRAEHKITRYYMDEFHVLLKDKQTAVYSAEIWKRFRKWGGIPTAITQNVKDLLVGHESLNIFENSDFILMLNQAAGDQEILAKQFHISPEQLKYVTCADAGEGLIFFGDTILPFVDHFPKDTFLYQLLTTKPQDDTIRAE